jgi:hypothetical protein
MNELAARDLASLLFPTAPPLPPLAALPAERPSRPAARRSQPARDGGAGDGAAFHASDAPDASCSAGAALRPFDGGVLVSAVAPLPSHKFVDVRSSLPASSARAPPAPGARWGGGGGGGGESWQALARQVSRAAPTRDEAERPVVTIASHLTLRGIAAMTTEATMAGARTDARDARRDGGGLHRRADHHRTPAASAPGAAAVAEASAALSRAYIPPAWAVGSHGVGGLGGIGGIGGLVPTPTLSTAPAVRAGPPIATAAAALARRAAPPRKPQMSNGASASGGGGGGGGGVERSVCVAANMTHVAARFTSLLKVSGR